MNAAVVALNRFGLGARPQDAVPADPQRWILSQLERYQPLPEPWRSRPTTSALLELSQEQQRAVRQAAEAERAGIRETYRRRARAEYIAAVGARMDSALQTDTPVVERLVHFWSNHFAVSVDKAPVLGLAGSFEADAIRPHVLGRFEDLLLAAVRHPAMLLYLDQAQSIGPNSPAALRAQGSQQRRGLNENLAREILELHTLGVRSGYVQADVTEFARALTGWALNGDSGFVRTRHEPGARTVLGRNYAPDAQVQALAILHDLAIAPQTARHIATKLARHFVADDPPPALVSQLADTFSRTGGDLAAVYRELVASPLAWQPAPAKFKTPWEWSVSSLRALGRREIEPAQASNLLNQLGQPVWRPGSPAGYDDIAGAWAAPDALLRRVEIAQRITARTGETVDARALAQRVLPNAVGEMTANTIARAESGRTALALLLVSPEFLRR